MDKNRFEILMPSNMRRAVRLMAASLGLDSSSYIRQLVARELTLTMGPGWRNDKDHPEGDQAVS